MNMIPKPEFPRPDRQRSKWLNLNGAWDFSLFTIGNEAAEAEFAENRNCYPLSINVPFPWGSPLSGIEEKAAGTGWYRRSAKYDNHGRLFLCFDGVDYFADVYINGKKAGSHRGGYGSFEIEVTDLWKSGENIIEVRAEDTRAETQLYGKQGYGEIQGIWQTVWLEERPKNYIKNWKTVTHINGLVEYTVEADALDGTIISANFDGNTWSAPVKDGVAKIDITLQNTRLWTPDTPNLYEGSLTMGEDVVNTYFGVREISTGTVGERGYQWILLNGKPIYLNGTLDQAFNPNGFFTYPSDKDMHDEAWRLKRLGLNMVRIHIKAEEPRKLYWMDKLGVLVMADIPCFWGEPNAEAREAYEEAMEEIIHRDINHPAIFSWVVFNETWGLFDKDEEGKKVYLKETQEWVRSIYKRAKTIDPTRLVEDNSPCNYDHVETDINTWHFYRNSYEVVRDHIREVVENTYPGSTYNFTEGNCQTNAPLMNSECGMVWGVDGSAGDSDLAWNYHYMLNEYRLHEKLCGFIFTEFHDVVNEFNGYYRIDDTDKEFGYGDFCRGMNIRDMHAGDFVATDCAPTRTVNAGETVKTPIVLSSFTDANHGKNCSINWELWYDGLEGRVVCDSGKIDLPKFSYGATKLSDITAKMPCENAVAVLSIYLMDESGETISRNFVTFDVRADFSENFIEIPVTSGATDGFDLTWTALENDKLCLGGMGQVSYEANIPENIDQINDIILHMELASKRVLSKDKKEIGCEQQDLGFMRGYLVDRGAFENSYWMTDNTRITSTVDIIINGETVSTVHLSNDWCDARGVLSWNRQTNHRKLDEAGSYGESQHIMIPTRLITDIKNSGKLTLTLKVKDRGGLAIYGRNCGRYPHGIMLEIK